MSSPELPQEHGIQMGVPDRCIGCPALPTVFTNIEINGKRIIELQRILLRCPGLSTGIGDLGSLTTKKVVELFSPHPTITGLNDGAVVISFETSDRKLSMGCGTPIAEFIAVAEL